MNKLLCCLVLCSCLLFSSCRSQTSSTSEKLSVVTTVFATFDFARHIGGVCADVAMLIPPGVESHSFEPTVQDIIRVKNSDIFIYIGGEGEVWVDKILSALDSNTKVLKLFDVVSLLQEEPVEIDEQCFEKETSQSEEGIDYDEHIWTSPVNAVKIAQSIADAFIARDKQNVGVYRKNLDECTEKLSWLDENFKNVVAGSSRKTLVFGDRFPFLYFTKRYGLRYLAAFKGCSTQTEASVKTIAFLIDAVSAEKIPVVFYTELSNRQIADSIALQTGAKVLEFHACHNISKDDFNAGVTYIDLMNRNLANLKEALY